MGHALHQADPHPAGSDIKPFVAVWSPPGRDLHEKDALWSLTLDLVTPESARIGYLRIYRRYSPANLLIDVNLLISHLQPALSTAAELILTTASLESRSARRDQVMPSQSG